MANGRRANTGRRASQWRKVYLAMDTATSDIWAVEFTPSSDGDSEPVSGTGLREPARVLLDLPDLPDLLVQIPEGDAIGTVTADGAYDTRRCHTAIPRREAAAIIPIRKNSLLWKEDCPADRARNEIRHATSTMAGHSENAGPDTTSAAGSQQSYPRRSRLNRWRPTCATAKPSGNAALHETRSATPPKSRPASVAGPSNRWPSPAQSSTASTPSAPPRSFAKTDALGESGSHASGLSYATAPRIALTPCRHHDDSGAFFGPGYQLRQQPKSWRAGPMHVFDGDQNGAVPACRLHQSDKCRSHPIASRPRIHGRVDGLAPGRLKSLIRSGIKAPSVGSIRSEATASATALILI